MKNLKNLIKKSGLSQRELAEKLKLNEQTLSRYIRGLSFPSYEILVLLADTLKVSIDSILGREVIAEPKTIRELNIFDIFEEKMHDLQNSLESIRIYNESRDDCLPVPLLEDPIAAGAPIPISGRSVESRYFTKSWLRRIHKPVLVTVGAGQRSMTPVILPGDLLLIDRRPVLSPLPEHIYAVNAEGGGTIKRCALVNDKLKLIPDNPDYSDHIIDVKEVDLQKVIVGRVVWIARELA